MQAPVSPDRPQLSGIHSQYSAAAHTSPVGPPQVGPVGPASGAAGSASGAAGSASGTVGSASGAVGSASGAVGSASGAVGSASDVVESTLPQPEETSDASVRSVRAAKRTRITTSKRRQATSTSVPEKAKREGNEDEGGAQRR